ncbi:MAG: hypothetical protein RLO50_02675 [Azospirillaceae bacterium]
MRAFIGRLGLFLLLFGAADAWAEEGVLDGVWLFSRTGEGPTENAVIFAGGWQTVIVRERVYPPQRFIFDGERLTLPDQHDWPGETIRFSGPDRFTASNGTEPLVHWRGRAAEPMGAVIHLAGSGFAGDLARDVLAVWADGGSELPLIEAVGVQPSIALMPGTGSRIWGWGMLVALPDRAAMPALDGIAVDTIDGPVPFHRHPRRPLVLATDPRNTDLIDAFMAY